MTRKLGRSTTARPSRGITLSLSWKRQVFGTQVKTERRPQINYSYAAVTPPGATLLTRTRTLVMQNIDYCGGRFARGARRLVVLVCGRSPSHALDSLRHPSHNVCSVRWRGTGVRCVLNVDTHTHATEVQEVKLSFRDVT